MNVFLRSLRIIMAIVWSGTLLLFFLDFSGFLTSQLAWLPRLQLIPSMLGLWLPGMLFILLLTLLLGRVYCSVMCPLGILQDVISRVKRTTYLLRKQKRKLYTQYEPARNMVRYTILAVCVLLFSAGISAPLVWLDPYGNFGRIASSLFSPLYITANNLLVQVHVGNLYTTQYVPANIISLSVAILTLIILWLLVWKKERLFCNLICPAGHLLSLFSRFAIFKINITSSACNHCGNCARNCKSACIDSDKQTIDASRCVTCFNCLPHCNRNAMQFKPVFGKTPKTPSTPAHKSPYASKTVTRRSFLQGVAVTAAAGSVALDNEKQKSQIKYWTRKFPLPPGAISIKHFQLRCTACQLCVSKCPTHVLQPNGLEYGMAGMMQPAMFFEPHRYCSFECTKCMDVCPTGALQKLPVEQKKRTQLGIVHFVRKECIVEANNKDCGACAEHCPTQAVKMVDYKNGLTIPEIDTTLCIGCGGCESICPVRPKAIFIEGLEVHTEAREPESRNAEEIEVNDFGF